MTTKECMKAINAAMAKVEKYDKDMYEANSCGGYQKAKDEKIDCLMAARRYAEQLADALRIEIECEDI